jgi:hemolysin III
MYRYFKKARDPISSYTHAIGAILSAIGSLAMIIYCTVITDFSPIPLIGAVIFGLSLVALYSASTIYHYVNTTKERIVRLRKLDHAMIYVLIAGTYTPITLIYLDKPYGYIFTSIMWAVAIIGIIVKLLWLNAPRLLSTAFYLLLGWAVVYDYKSFHAVPSNCMALIFVWRNILLCQEPYYTS